MLWTKLMMNKLLISSFQKNQKLNVVFLCSVPYFLGLSHSCVYLPAWHITNICITHVAQLQKKKTRGEICAFILKGNLANFRFPLPRSSYLTAL